MLVYLNTVDHFGATVLSAAQLVRKPAGSAQEKARGEIGGPRRQRHQRSGAAARNEGVLVPGLGAGMGRDKDAVGQVVLVGLTPSEFVTMEMMHACRGQDDHHK